MQQPPEMKFNPHTGAVAIKTAQGVTYPWFIFHPANGGHPANDNEVAAPWEDM